MYWSSTLIWLKRTIQGILDTHVHFWHGLGLTCKCGPSGPLMWVWHIILNQSIAIGKPLWKLQAFHSKRNKSKKTWYIFSANYYAYCKNCQKGCFITCLWLVTCQPFSCFYQIIVLSHFSGLKVWKLFSLLLSIH